MRDETKNAARASDAERARRNYRRRQAGLRVLTVEIDEIALAEWLRDLGFLGEGEAEPKDLVRAVERFFAAVTEGGAKKRPEKFDYSE